MLAGIQIPVAVSTGRSSASGNDACQQTNFWATTNGVFSILPDDGINEVIAALPRSDA
jgi:hypothetical protein